MFAAAISALALAQTPEPTPWPQDLISGEVAAGVTEHIFQGEGCKDHIFDVPIPGPCTDPTEIPGKGQAWWAGLAVGSGEGVIIGYGESQDACLSSISFYKETFPSKCMSIKNDEDGQVYSFFFDGKFPCSSEEKSAARKNTTSTIQWSKKMQALSEDEKIAEYMKFHRAATSKSGLESKSATPMGSVFASALKKQVSQPEPTQIDITFGGSANVFQDADCKKPVGGTSTNLVQAPGLCSIKQHFPWAGPDPVYGAAVCITGSGMTNWIGGGGASVEDCWKGLIETQDAHGSKPGECEPMPNGGGYIKVMCAKPCA